MNVNLTVVRSDLADYWMTRLRDRETGLEGWREARRRATMVLAAYAFADLSGVITPKPIMTPLPAPCQGVALQKDIVLVSILRAGMALVEACTFFLPSAIVATIGLKRDEHTALATEYHRRFPPDMSDVELALVDPMLATGGSACDAIRAILSHQAHEDRIRLVCLVAAPEGIDKVQREFPAVRIFTLAVDERLTTAADQPTPPNYIWPGLGDAGDREFGI